MSGFSGAAATKALMLSVGVASVAVSLLQLKPYCPVILVPHITKYHQLWRVAVQPFIFINSSELFVWEILMYNVSRHVERCLGTRKFASFVFLTVLTSSLLSFLALLLFHRPFGLNKIPPGPISLAFAILLRYHQLVPNLYTFKVLGLELGDKVYVLGLASQLLYSSFLLPASGLLASHLLASHPVLAAYRLPAFLATFGSTYLVPALGSLRTPKRSALAWPEEEASSASSSASRDIVSFGGLRLRRAAGASPATVVTPRTAASRPGASVPGTPTGAPPASGPTRATAVAASPSPPSSPPTASMVSQWVEELTDGSGVSTAARAEQVTQLEGMFPSLTRNQVVRALQQSDFDQARAVDFLLLQADA